MPLVERMAKLLEKKSRMEMELFLLNTGLILTGREILRMKDYLRHRKD